MTATPGFAWSGPGRVVTTRGFGATVTAVVALPVLCLVPLGSPGWQFGVVGVVLLAAVAAAARPGTTEASWRIDGEGVRSRDGVGPARHVPADRYDALAFGVSPRGGDELGLLHTTGAGGPVVAHAAGLSRAGAPVSLCLVARQLGLALRLPPTAPARLAEVERSMGDALARRTATPTDAPDVSFRDPPPRGIARSVLVRLVTTTVGLVLVLLLLAPHPGAPVRVAAALGTWLVLAALPGLFRLRSTRASVTWRIGSGHVDVVDTRDGRWRFATDAIGVGVVVMADAPGHGQSPRQAVLVVDRQGRPVAELPLRTLPPAAVTAALRDHGVPTVVAGLAPWDLRSSLY